MVWELHADCFSSEETERKYLPKLTDYPHIFAGIRCSSAYLFKEQAKKLPCQPVFFLTLSAVNNLAVVERLKQGGDR